MAENITKLLFVWGIFVHVSLRLAFLESDAEPIVAAGRIGDQLQVAVAN